MKNDRAYPCDTLIITNVNGNNEENGFYMGEIQTI